MEITDWSDMKRFEDGNFSLGSKSTADNGQNNDGGNNAEESHKEETKQQDSQIGFEVTGWSDLRKFDDDHDDEWFKYQEKQLAEQYGGTFIKVIYSNNGRIAYYCEICFAECNAKKSLDLHCSGMKHLKKKDMWEKDGKPTPPGNLGAGSENAPSEKLKKRPKSPQPPSMRKRQFSPGRNGPYDRNRDVPPPFNYDPYYPRDRYYDGHDSHSRDADIGFGLSRGPGGYGAPAAPFDRPDSRGSAYPRYSPRRDRTYSPVSRKDYDHGRDKRYSEFDDRKHSPQRPRYYGDRRSRSRDRKRSPYGSRKDRTRSPYSRSRRDSRSASSGRGRAPPSPPKISRTDEVEKKVNLTNSPAGSLLQKLAECCVKSGEDADLALNVVASLTKSLKEYCQRNEETKLAELLMEAELKVGTVKALKAGMKMLSNFTGDTATGAITPGSVIPTFLGVSQGSVQAQMSHPPPSYKSGTGQYY